MWPSMSSKTANTFLSEARAGLGACTICGRRCLARSSVPASKRSSAAPAERYGLRARGMRWTRGYSGNEGEKPAAAGAGRAGEGGKLVLLTERVQPFAVLALGGLDFEAHLGPKCHADEPADAVGLPAGGLHEFGQAGPFGTA